MPKLPKAKYWKKVLRVEILCEGETPVVIDDLKEAHYQITEGHCSGIVEEIMVAPLTREECAEALIAQGSDPDFLVEDWEEENA